MRILMSGSTGFIGRRLKNELLSRGHIVFCLRRVNNNPKSQSFKNTDIPLCSTKNLEEILDSQNLQFDSIIHSATSYGKDEETLSEINEVNYILPKRLFEIAIKNKVKTFINFDTSLPDCTNAYSTTKAKFRKFASEHYDVRNLNFLNLRLQTVLGVDQRINSFPYKLVKSCFLNEEMIEITPGEQIRDFIHVNDVMDCISFLIRIKNTFKNGFNDFEIGSGKGISLKLFSVLLKKISKSNTKLSFGAKNYRSNETFINVANPEKLRDLGWVAKIELSDAIKMMLQELKETR